MAHKLKELLLVFSVLILMSANIVQPVEPKTAAAVIAADEAWGRAEINGDGDYLEKLLLPDYASISSSGASTSKATIVLKARSRTGTRAAEYAKYVAEWKATHPIRPEVVLIGDTAILKWILPGEGDRVSSSDIFVYRAGRWHAAYSQHSASEK